MILHRLTLPLCALVLAGCASSPSSNISLIPTQIAEQTQRDGAFTQPLKWSRNKPDCKGECPAIHVDSLVFPGNPKLTDLVDHALAVMTTLDDGKTLPYDSLRGFESYFWQTAGGRDRVDLTARARYRNQHLTVLELSSWRYLTGAAHGISATQFLNWDNHNNRVLSLNEVLLPGKRGDFERRLAEAHRHWLTEQPGAQEDPAGWQRLWPFQASDNFALTDQGVVVKYDTYAIAPYSSGQPELLLPYPVLQDILQPRYLPSTQGR